MDAFILEKMTSTGWRRSGETFWCLDAAKDEANRLIKRSLARKVRVLQVFVDLNAVAEIPEEEASAL
jgi:hypothetical protein